MNTLDIILLALIGLGAVLGFAKGALKQLAGLLGLVVGLLAAKALYATVAKEVFSRVTDNLTVAQVLSFVAIWVAVPLLFWLGCPAESRRQTAVRPLRAAGAAGKGIPACRARHHETNL